MLLDDSIIANLLFEEGQGKVGNVEIFVGSISVTNGATILASTSGKGDAGIININASDSVIFDGQDIDGNISGVFSDVNSGAEGNAGGINITTRSLEVTNGAQLIADTRGKGDGGFVTITATDSVVFNSGDNSENNSGAFSSVESEAEGNAGGINIITRSLEVLNGAQLSANIFGTGKAGGINITTSSLEVLNGAQLSASTFGTGNAGSVTIRSHVVISFPFMHIN